MSESKLKRYARTHVSRIYTNKTQEGERQCHSWVSFPDDEENNHPSKRLYAFTTPERKELWLCNKCLPKIADIYQFVHRQRINKSQSVVPRVAIESVEKSYDMMLVITLGSARRETIRCKAYPER